MVTLQTELNNCDMFSDESSLCMYLSFTPYLYTSFPSTNAADFHCESLYRRYDIKPIEQENHKDGKLLVGQQRLYLGLTFVVLASNGYPRADMSITVNSVLDLYLVCRLAVVVPWIDIFFLFL